MNYRDFIKTLDYLYSLGYTQEQLAELTVGQVQELALKEFNKNKEASTI